jgi:coenzyme F420-reducing hydrogenase beta subunit
MRECWLCGANGACDPLEEHHIFGGALRKKSEKYGLTVYLCGDQCHRNGTFAVHKNAKTMQRLHEHGELKWLAEHHATIEDFRKEFYKNYL